MRSSSQSLAPAHPTRPGPSALGLLDQACRGLREASGLTHPPDRYAAAHLAALRAAAAVLAARTRPDMTGLRRRRPANAWVLLTAAAPELAEWAAFFAAGAAKRAAAEADLPNAVTAREADDLVTDVLTFLRIVETTLGMVPGVVSEVGAPVLTR